MTKGNLFKPLIYYELSIWARPGTAVQRNVIDRIIMGAVALLAALPFGQVFYFKIAGGMLSAFEVIYVTIAMLILIKILTFGKIKKTFLPFLLFTATITMCLFISVGVYNIPIVVFVRHLRSYLPFLIGTMLLLAGINVTTERYLRVLIIASIFSSTTAMVMHYIMPDVLAKMLSSSEELVSITTIYGRLYWTNATLFFFVLLSFMLPRNEIHISKLIMSIALLLTFTCLFKTLNRTMMIGLALFLVGHIFLEKRITLSIERSIKVIAIGVIGILIIFGIMSFDPKVNHLVKKRYMGSGYGIDQVYETAVVMERFPMYEQYANSIKTYFLIGQGLGRPFSTQPNGDEVPTTDISVLSFLLPFGLLGLSAFCVFIYTLFRLLSIGNNCINERGIRIIKLFLIISLIISLNIDLFSRNNFVIYVTMLVLTLQNNLTPKLISAQPRITF